MMTSITVMASEPRSLFNGQNLDNWYKFIRQRGRDNDPKGVFTVVDGVIRVSGEEYGCITTSESFQDYKLTLEYKWGGKTWGNRKASARDSGVLIHSNGPDGGFGGVWMVSIEANLVEGGIGDFWMVCNKNDGLSATCDVTVRNGMAVFDPEKGTPRTITANADRCFAWSKCDTERTDTLGFHGKNDIDRVGEWNEMSIVAKGNSMDVYINGTLVNRVYNLVERKGKIQLQSEGAEIFFRNITIQSLDK